MDNDGSRQKQEFNFRGIRFANFAMLSETLLKHWELKAMIITTHFEPAFEPATVSCTCNGYKNEISKETAVSRD